jgi:hypothetical protein
MDQPTLAQLAQIAEAAMVEERTALNHYLGRTVKGGRVRERICQAARSLGLPEPPEPTESAAEGAA